jgi:predicted TIM-barrel enzyme
LIVTGTATGAPTNPERARMVKHALPDAPVWIGSGVNADTVNQLLSIADGAIVGSALKLDGTITNPVDLNMAQTLVRAAGR